MSIAVTSGSDENRHRLMRRAQDLLCTLVRLADERSLATAEKTAIQLEVRRAVEELETLQCKWLRPAASRYAIREHTDG
jgi:hypothetical protein